MLSVAILTPVFGPSVEVRKSGAREKGEAAAKTPGGVCKVESGRGGMGTV